jgi:cell division protein FtsB
VAPAATQELEGLRAEIARLRERVQELVQERDYLRALADSLAQGQRLMLEARPRRRWHWPWQRGDD